MSRRERKKEETRESIITTAVGLFKDKGFQATSMEEIAEKSDVSKGTLYNYFQDKESILVGYFQSVIAAYGPKMKERYAETHDIQESLYGLLNFMSSIFKTDRELAINYFKYRMPTRFDMTQDGSHRSGIEKWVMEIMDGAQKDGQLRQDISSLVLTRNFQFLAMSFLVTSLYTEEPLEIDNIKDQLVGLFLNGAKL